MRVALLSDIHGNLVALDTVLADANSLGIEQLWLVGDHAAIGPEPVGVLERVAQLENVVVTRGNTDRYVVTGQTPPPHLSLVQTRPELISIYAEIAASFAWTRGCITACGWLGWLEELPLEKRLTLPGGVRILAVHASPGTDDGDGVHPGRSNAELRAMLGGADADIVFVGHTHEPMIRRVDDVVVVNLGSVSNPKAPDLRASYVVLHATASGIELEHRRVAYDHEAFIESVRRSRHPSSEFIFSHQRGERTGHAPHADHTVLAPGERVRVSTGQLW